MGFLTRGRFNLLLVYNIEARYGQESLILFARHKVGISAEVDGLLYKVEDVCGGGGLIRTDLDVKAPGPAVDVLMSRRSGKEYRKLVLMVRAPNLPFPMVTLWWIFHLKGLDIET